MRATSLPANSEQWAAPASRGLRLLAAPALLMLAMGAVVAAVHPAGEFPVNDDWGYTRMVQSLVERGRLEVHAGTTATAVVHVFWGGLIAGMFGLSHTALRASTLGLAAAGVLGFYVLLREVLDDRRALIGALLLLFNPLYVFLSYTFLTDVPFVSLALWAMVCYSWALRKQGSVGPRPGWLAMGSALAGAAYLVRQFGAALPLAAFGGLVLTLGWRAALRPSSLAALLGPFLSAVLVGAYFDAQRGPIRQSALLWLLDFWSEQGPGMVGVVLARLAETCSTLGLFSLPASLALLSGGAAFGPSRSQRWLAGALLATVAVGFGLHVFLFEEDPLVPHMRNLLSPNGFLVSYNYYAGTLPTGIMVSREGRILVTAAAILGAVLLIVAVVTALPWRRLRGMHGPVAIPLLFSLITLVLTLSFHRFMDRYLVALLPGALLVALLSARTSRQYARLALAGAALLAVWSIGWEREYLDRREALWEAGQALVTRGIAPSEIDGGFEWNAWYRGEQAVANAVQRARPGETGPRLEKRIHATLDPPNAHWLVAFGPPANEPNDRIVAIVPYGRGQQVVAIQRP